MDYIMCIGQRLVAVVSDKLAFPLELDPWLCSRTQIRQFAIDAKKAGIQYLGLCCGSRSHFLREMADAVGKKPAACQYAPNLSQHFTRLGKGSAAAGHLRNYKI